METTERPKIEFPDSEARILVHEKAVNIAINEIGIRRVLEICTKYLEKRIALALNRDAKQRWRSLYRKVKVGVIHAWPDKKPD